MEPVNHLRCRAGKDAEQICFSAACLELSLLCLDRKCQCNQSHKKCLTISLQQLLESVRDRGLEYLPHLQDLMAKYEKMAKLLTVEMEQLRKIIDHPDLLLAGPEGRLSLLLR